MHRLSTTTDWLRSLSLYAVAAGALIAYGPSARADVFLLADEAYPAMAEVFTVDPEIHSFGNRGLATGREFPQSFQVAATFDVKKILL